MFPEVVSVGVKSIDGFGKLESQPIHRPIARLSNLSGFLDVDFQACRDLRKKLLAPHHGSQVALFRNVDCTTIIGRPVVNIQVDRSDLRRGGCQVSVGHGVGTAMRRWIVESNDDPLVGTMRYEIPFVMVAQYLRVECVF